MAIKLLKLSLKKLRKNKKGLLAVKKGEKVTSPWKKAGGSE